MDISNGNKPAAGSRGFLKAVQNTLSTLLISTAALVASGDQPAMADMVKKAQDEVQRVAAAPADVTSNLIIAPSTPDNATASNYHFSHSSHRSHASHVSHASHYSSSW
jgi:hypothetical protein